MSASAARSQLSAQSQQNQFQPGPVALTRVLLLLLISTGLFQLSCQPRQSGQGQAAPATTPLAGMSETWRPIWSRQSGAAKVFVDEQVRHAGQASTRVEHTGRNEWSLRPQAGADGRPVKLAVREGDIIEVSAWVKVQGNGQVAVGWADAQGTNDALPDIWGGSFDAVCGASLTYATPDWVETRARFVVPTGIWAVAPRMVGNGAATVWVHDLKIARVGKVSDFSQAAHGPITLRNPSVMVQIDARTGALTVQDRRTGQSWVQKPLGHDVVAQGASIQGERTAQLSLFCVPLDLKFEATVSLDPAAPELSIGLGGDGRLPQALAYPYPFVSQKGMDVIVPQDEGVTYPVGDPAIKSFRLNAYSGYGLCMRFWGITDGNQGVMAIIETPDDAAVQLNRRADGLLYLAPEWDPQKGRLGYERKLRYVFFDTGGYVAMCKRYRAYSQQIGLFKTLAQKRQDNPNIDRLVGAVNVWCMDRGIEPVAMVKDMQAAGISRILWSRGGGAEAVKTLNEMGVLTSRMDNYQDVRDPANARGRGGGAAQPGGTTASNTLAGASSRPLGLNQAWPKDIILDARGDWIKGWEDRPGIFCAVMCDKQALTYADQMIGRDLGNVPYTCRFVDTTMCTAWHECYSPDHPMTRTESRDLRVELLRLVSGKYKLVCGSENGNDIAVPVADYFEGMLSIGPYRLPDSARSMQAVIEQVPEEVVKFQVSGKYRLPLWELVYHDCALAHWYWGDYNNKAPSIWDQRDLVNALYGTAPLFMLNRASWDANRERFVRSYQTTCPIARATGYSEMTSHRYLTPDRSVQQTAFANGVTVTVNFGPEPFTAADGTTIAPKSVKVLGIVELDKP